MSSGQSAAIPRQFGAAGRRDATSRFAVEAAAWTFGPQQVAGFWRRRQVHETVMHLYDALASQERETDWVVGPELAWDGVEEVTTIFYPRQVQRGRTGSLPGTLRLVAEDAAGEPLEIGDSEPTVVLKAPAAEVLLTLWKRVLVADPEVAALVAGTAITP